ncbi:hypothetical protein QFZ77_006506 [Paenibacillus sp. V4I3]|nr:hypothetical protein [Paenibacillus sp. V4I3]
MDEQKAVCRKYEADFLESPKDLKLGISLNVKEDILPINGLRIYPEGDTTGWYIWSGEELSQDPDFFVPIHVEHIDEWVPNIKKFLGLPAGWRFLIAGDYYEDIWFDPEILED